MSKLKTPFIHLFSTPLGCYFYDVNTNCIVEVEETVYAYLSDGDKTKEAYVKKELGDLKEKGYLKTKRVEQTYHPLTELLPYYAKSKIEQLILQVTQNCNLRCDYCVYSGNYETRGHSDKRMSFATACRAIDFFREHTDDQDEVVIGFYGGEPLLEFRLIKQCVDYAKRRLKGKKIEYSITTNATLFSDEIIEFFIKNNFSVTVSLDGPKEFQDECRRFSYGNKGSYDIVMKNLYRIREFDLDYFEKNIRINTVLVTERGYKCIDDFFMGEDIFSNLTVSASVVSDNYSKNKIVVSEKFHIEYQYELFKTFLAEMRELPKEKMSSLIRGYMKELYRICGDADVKSREELPTVWHRGGPCIPGIMRLFVTVDGTFLPCERVCEISERARIGSLETGLNLEKMEAILNVEKITEKECKRCWAYSECSSCIRYGTACDEKLKETFLKHCTKIKSALENTYKDYTVLRKLGYDFEELDR